MNVCHKCGTMLIEGQRICPSCGADNSEVSRPTEASSQEEAGAQAEAEAKAEAAGSASVSKSPHGPKSVFNSTTKAFIAAGLAILFAAGLVFWQVKAGRAGAIELTADDMTKIAESFPPQAQMQLASH